MLPLPPKTNDTLELADWLELNALIGTAGQASLDNMRDALRSGSLGAEPDAPPDRQSAHLESIAAGVRSEIEDRSQRAQSAYPFSLRGSSLERAIRRNGRFSSTYAFCLMLSFLSWDDRKLAGHYPDRIFEEVSCLVARRYTGGRALRFGWPRSKTVLPGGFASAVEVLCKRVGEGLGYRSDYATGTEKDAGVDIVAWLPIDKRSGKLLLFGACATGQNWIEKLTELQPETFCRYYMRENVEPPPAKAFFTSSIVPNESWGIYSGRAGVLFDRCRVSRFVPKLAIGTRHGDVREWMRQMIEQARPLADQ